jgi:chaperonin GroES
MKKTKKAKAVKKSAPKKAPKAVQKAAPVAVVKKNTLGTPYGDRILVKPQAAETQTSFGIIIPDQAKEKPEQGVVVAIGEGKVGQDGTIIPMRVKVGDTIMFSKYGFDEIKIGGTEYYLIREDSITFIF